MEQMDPEEPGQGSPGPGLLASPGAAAAGPSLRAAGGGRRWPSGPPGWSSTWRGGRWTWPRPAAAGSLLHTGQMDRPDQRPGQRPGQRRLMMSYLLWMVGVGRQPRFDGSERLLGQAGSGCWTDGTVKTPRRASEPGWASCWWFTAPAA